MKQLQSLSHTVWECKYHIVWIPKYRKKVLYGKIREELVGVFHELANRRGCKILEGHLCVDHVHMLLSIPPKYGVAEVVGYLKGKSAIEIAKHFEKVNACLKTLGDELELDKKLTTYVARHSYATTLKRAGVSTSLICDALGHSSERVTQIYLDSFENTQLKAAMKNLL